MKNSNQKSIPRPPVIAVMGHVDHGKSTLLDYIRKTNVAEGEAGGITQHISAYEFTHATKDGRESRITFLDTPGHEAFSSLRVRGASAADIAVLVVSAEDGVMPQTKEALTAIKQAAIPFIVAINKIDKPGANVERTKQTLAENEVYVEGYGGNVSFVPISAKTGEGVSDLLDTLLLTAELEELTGNPDLPGEGIILESNVDPKKGIAATVIVKDGTFKQGSVAVADQSLAPLRSIEDFQGKKIKEASFSSPIRIVGWNSLPEAGSLCVSFAKKKDAEAYIEEQTEKRVAKKAGTPAENQSQTFSIPVILKADASGSLEALVKEISKVKNDRAAYHVIASGIGPITEKDVKLALTDDRPILVGFNVSTDTRAKHLALREGVTPETFDIIYKLTEWLSAELSKRTPKVRTEEISGTAKILKAFSRTKDKQVLGGRVESGVITDGSPVKILRRGNEIAAGFVRELQQSRVRTREVEEGKEFGVTVECKLDIAPGDIIQASRIVES